MDIKQVIVIRKDLKIRRGKECAQAAHAAMAWMRDLIMRTACSRRYLNDRDFVELGSRPIGVTNAQMVWLEGLFTKVCLQVNSEAELMAVHDAAKAAGLTVFLITDMGATEFHGVPTKTCLAIGPDLAENIDKVTKDLKLY